MIKDSDTDIGPGGLDHIQYDRVTPRLTYDSSDGQNDTHLFVRGVPEKYKVLFSIVCTRFPELANENIRFRLKNINTTMTARPSLMFWKRKYYITINNDDRFRGIHFDRIPFNAQVGLVAHEMCHILDYRHKSWWRLIQTGLGLLIDRHKIAYEKSIDYLTIYKGFGYQLRDWAQYAMFDGEATPEYKNFKKIHYLNPSQIDSIIEATYSNMGRKMD